MEMYSSVVKKYLNNNSRVKALKTLVLVLKLFSNCAGCGKKKSRFVKNEKLLDYHSIK